MTEHQIEVFGGTISTPCSLSSEEFAVDIETFSEFGKQTQILDFPDPRFPIPVYVNEFWTAKQRAAHSLHEVSYRACFKPQLPKFFIDRLTTAGDVVYDPFMGRGTSLIEAALNSRRPIGCDINPLSRLLVEPRFTPPSLEDVRIRLAGLNLARTVEVWDELLVFYHPDTLRAISNLRQYLLERQSQGAVDQIDSWIRMVATNRLTGHSPGFFSVYTMPPNQAVSLDSQRKINEKRQQTPPLRDVKEIILRKTKSLLSKLRPSELEILGNSSRTPLILTGSSDSTPQIESDSVRLVVTSPPFLDIVDYKSDNWLRCWFNGIDAQQVKIWQLKNPASWQEAMTGVFKELYRILIPGGFIAFEIGEVRNGKVLLETLVARAASNAGLTPLMLLVNDQIFTKTSNCWGVDNLKKGTNTNRIVLIAKH